MDDSPDCLPKGWTVEIKSRKSGPKAGKKYKCYIAPLTGFRFYSKRKVSEYLNIENIRNTCRLNKRKPEIEMPSTNQAIVEWRKETKEELPPGWTKTMKCRQTGDKTRKDSFYIDPATGYIFRSRRDVFRYLRTGEIGRHACKPKNGCFGDFEVDEKNSSPTADKRQKVEDSTIKRCLFTGQSSNLNETRVKNEIVEPSVKKEIIPVLEHALIQSDVCADVSPLITPKSDDSKKMLGKELRSTGRIVTALPAPVASSEEQHQKHLEEGGKQSGNKRTQLKSSKNKDNKELSFPRRASKRLAGISADPVQDLEIGQQKSQVASVLEANPVKEEKTGNSTDQVPEQVDQLGFDPESKPTISATESGKVLLKCENDEHENSLHKGGDTLLIEEQPIKYEAASENHGAAQKANEKPESPLLLPFGDSWPDPCLEFAFKTLTGAIPVEDNLMIEDYFLHQLGSSVQNQNTSDLFLPDGGVYGFSQTSDLFRFDPPPSSPQLQNNPALPASGNANMISFGGNGLHEQPGGTKNSRDR